MSRAERIDILTKEQRASVHLTIDAESHRQAGHRENAHFRLIIARPWFEPENLPAPHRRVQAPLQAQREGGMPLLVPAHLHRRRMTAQRHVSVTRLRSAESLAALAISED